MWVRLHRGLLGSAARATRLSPPLLCARASPRLLCSSASSPPEHTSATPDATPTAREIAAASAREHGFAPRPSYSRAARRERLLAALELAKAGEEFELPKAQPVEIPGPCGAVMNLLRERGPLTTEAMWAALEERYPGVVKSRQHLEDQVLGEHLRNKLIKVSPLCYVLIVHANPPAEWSQAMRLTYESRVHRSRLRARCRKITGHSAKQSNLA